MLEHSTPNEVVPEVYKVSAEHVESYMILLEQ